MSTSKGGRSGRYRNPAFETVLGLRIRAARIAAQMSQTALGAAIGVSFQQVQKYETGKDRVTASTLQGLAAALGVHPGSFYGDAIPALIGGIPDLAATMRIAKRIQGIRDPGVVKRLMALVDLLSEAEGDAGDKSVAQVERPVTSGEAH